MEQKPVLHAVCFATAASHVAVTRYGSQQSFPTREEIDALVPMLLEKVHEFAAT